MANLITLSRLLLLFVIVLIVYTQSAAWQLASVLLLVLMFVTDGVDGYVARKREETSHFGATFDIACDRIVEWSLWIVFVDLGLVPIWVLLLFVARGVIVDAIRATQAAAHRATPFSMLSSAIGQRLVAGRFMRIGYAALKAVTFCWLMFSYSLPTLAPMFFAQHAESFRSLSMALILACIVVCLVRGIPVIAEFLYTERRVLLGRLAGPTRAPRGE